MASLTNLRDSFARLSPREKMLVGACVAALLGFVLFLVIHYTGGKMRSLYCSWLEVFKEFQRRCQRHRAVVTAQGQCVAATPCGAGQQQRR